MRNPKQVLNNLCEHSKVSGYRFERLYRNLFNEQMFYVAYQRIYAKQGNMTSGTDGKTIDQMSIQRIESLIASLKNETYQPNPAKRVYIPKKNGKKRPLGIPSFEDKLVQEVIRMMLEAIYEGYFEYTSHGFRPFKSCHTALSSIQKRFVGAKWFIEGDIKGFFDNIDHCVLIGILEERINDVRFIRLIRKFLKAGYVEHWQFNHTYSGTPQGGIISPILANIYLDKFDKFMDEYAKRFDKGNKRRVNPAYNRICNKRNSLKRKLNAETDVKKREILISQIRNMRTEMQQIPYGNDMDEQYRRLKYVRYADDFLIGVIGSKSDCEVIKADLAKYMQEQLKLELSDEKTLITNAQDKAKFLGYEIYVQRSESKVKNSLGRTNRMFNGNVRLHVSTEIARNKLLAMNAMVIKQVNGKEIWWAESRGFLTSLKEEDIIAQYNLEIRGFYNYYSIANNISAVGDTFGGIMKRSCIKTLAHKHNSTMRKEWKRYREGQDFVVRYKDSKGQEKCRVLYNEGFRRKQVNDYAECDHMPNTCFLPQASLVERLKNGVCELCGNKAPLMMHHVRTLSKLKADTEWNKLMLKKGRKTLAVCEKCNALIQSYD
ncbi:MULTISPECIES: reverse transcriptase/maturase family protein [Bacteroides]|uniref:reverse transcriptase/maturase family protein n=1 Tax=Bacteroides TaxID=816 RepID=UPI001CE232CB|nr:MULTISPECIES: reverse transcriptase/maturase family protein [Bacteroides]MCA6035521.1 group II intron reverse transcriptase/maturase [Bacteroides thetaiotaomicron]MDU7593280.1 reverse transcriptase domain-containing protein [Bacteroides sp.]